ncbi:hypothetical protein DAPPUDRAFT_319661 [Daphnia pulex]|uniref:MGA conserved domain-containing protein n=1 Tax=Daphnia pulex TaxID=6669 RepID=E9GMF2_DAPPU|nr:hypothetical protein DAPPUDRAFT_319661 [Daphnia pulex]|eukprot:EFX79357.1 hypothetical protein DAPPUDRAFT_319661 [Daphnia pulex]
MDASLFVLSAEPYYEDYSVPYPHNKRRLTDECKKRFCTMGCICDSLNSTRPFYEHCNHPECMFYLVCSYKHNLRYRDSSSPTERYDSREFNKFSENDLLKQLSSIKEEIYFKTDLIDRLVSELNEKQLEIDNLKKQLMGKSIFRSNITLRPSPLQSEASATVKKVKAEEDKKGKMKERPKVEIKNEAEGRRAKAKVEVKDAKVKISHAHADGLHANSFPFDERFLNRLAENTTCSMFVRQLMRHTFTFDFLATTNCSSMNDEHMAAIIDATMKRFKFYHRNNGELVHVTPELVKKEDLPPVLSLYSEVSVDDLESNCSSPPDLTASVPYGSLESDELDIDICIADAKKALAKIVSKNEVSLQEVNKARLDSYSIVECDKIDGKMFHSFVTMDDLEMFATGRATNRGGNPSNSQSDPSEKSNQVSTSTAGLTCIKTRIGRDIEKSRTLSNNKIRVFTIDEYDDFDETTSKEKETSSSESDLEFIVIEDHNVKPGEHTEKVTTMQDPDGLMNIDEKISPDKRDASFVILPEETYYEDYEVPGLLKQPGFQSVVECGNRFCIMGCVCSSLHLLKPRSQRCLHMECMFDHACIIKSKSTPSTPTKNKDNKDDSLVDLLSQNLLMKSEIKLQKDINHELGVRLLQRESEIEKFKKQFATIENRKNINVMKKDELMMHGRRVQDGHYVDSFPFKESMLDSLAKNTTVSIFIRLLMRKMYTPEYLSSKTMRNMKKEHMAAITEAAKERFSIYRGRQGHESNLTEEKIKLVIVSEFSFNQQKEKRKNISWS